MIEGNRVRVVLEGKNPTIIEGTVSWVDEKGALWDENDFLLASSAEQVEILVPQERFSVVRSPITPAFTLVRLHDDNMPWLGTDGESDKNWYSDEEVQKLLSSGGWKVAN